MPLYSQNCGSHCDETLRWTSPVFPPQSLSLVCTLARRLAEQQPTPSHTLQSLSIVWPTGNPQEPCHTVISRLHGNTSLIKKIWKKKKLQRRVVKRLVWSVVMVVSQGAAECLTALSLTGIRRSQINWHETWYVTTLIDKTHSTLNNAEPATLTLTRYA